MAGGKEGNEGRNVSPKFPSQWFQLTFYFTVLNLHFVSLFFGTS